MPNHSNFRLRGIACYIALAISGGSVNAWADDSIQFDPRFLELKGDTKIDLGKFSKKGYVDAGKYNLRVFINKQPLSDEYDINWYVSENDPTKNYACLTPELVAALGLKEGIAKSLQWTHNDECLKPGQLDGMEVENDLSQSALLLTVPQAYLEYTSSDWDPPSRWDDGIPGLIADYSLNAQTRHQEQGGVNQQHQAHYDSQRNAGGCTKRPVTNIEELYLDDVTDQQVFRTAHQVGHIEQAHRWQHHQQTSGNNSRHR